MTSKTALAASAAPRAMFHAPVTGSPMLRGPQVAYAPDDGLAALSVDAAVAALREPEVEPAAEEAPEGEPAAEPEAEEAPAESEPEPTGEEPLDPEAVIEEEPETQEPESDPETPAIAAPKSWDAEERALFLTFPPKAQAIIANREEQRDRAVSKAQQESTQARKQAEAELVGLAQVKTTFDEIATRANKVFADKWANVDWVALARSDPATYTIAKAEHDAEVGELQRVQQAQADADTVRQTAERVEFQNYVQGEFAKLSEIAPELADPKTGAARRTEVTQLLLGDGIPEDAIRLISAAEMRIAWEAAQFRKLKASGKAAAARPAAPATRPNPAPSRAAAPSAAVPARPPAQRSVEAAKSHFASNPSSTDAAVALLRASRGAN